MSKYHPDFYFSFQPVSDSDPTRRHITNLRNRYAIFDKGIVGKFLYYKYPNTALRCLSKFNLTTDFHVLGIGCGTGALLYSLSMLGFNNLLCVDPFNEKDIEYNNALNKMNIPFEEKRSHSTAQTGSIFTKQKMAAYRRKTEKLNKTKQGDQAAFYLRKA